MLTSQHATVGALVAVASGNPIAGFVAGVASHLLLDSLPHVDSIPLLVKEKDKPKSEDLTTGTWILAISDGLIAVGIWVYVGLVTQRWELMFFGAFGGILPDLIDNAPWWKMQIRKTKVGNAVHILHEMVHFHWYKSNLLVYLSSIALQIVITIGGTWALLYAF